ncbi:MAG: asparagine synthase (glutamine-hydrolyzing) [Pseudohongiellaceae bacterium]
MCGIAGKLWLTSDRPGDASTVAAMVAALAHRGPDGRGVVSSGPAALGHRRLSIVDLSERGSQPMASLDGRLLLVANGEIYNHKELRAELSAKGHRFRSDSDNEVLLPLYREYWQSEGPGCLDRIDGMFAFALWDKDARRLVLARDRMGQKPLVYAATDESIVFASELSALTAEPTLDRTPNDDALADYLAFRCVPHPSCAWKGAAKLPAAHALVVEDGAASLHCYWRLSPGMDESPYPTLDDAADEVLARLDTAVSRRLMADVPVGALLSGGVDSAAVVALMARHLDHPVKTFTIGFDDPAYDERIGARAVANLVGSEHHERLVAPDAMSILDKLTAHYGEPFADSSAIPTFLVSELAAESVKVVLTGDGGDEAFAGYDRYRALDLAERLSGGVLGRPLSAAVRGAASMAGLFGAGGHRSVSTRLTRFADGLDAAPRQRNHLWRLASSTARLSSLMTPEGRQRLGTPSHYGPRGGQPLSLNQALVLDVEKYLPDDILVKLDIASMAHSLEARSPFLDRELMEFAASLPGRLKLAPPGSPGQRPGKPRGKWVLRHALRQLLPADVLWGKKQGFGVPLDAWFRGPLLGHARDVLLSPEARGRGLFDGERVGRLIDAHARRDVAAHELLFTLLVLERWFLAEDDR